MSSIRFRISFNRGGEQKLTSAAILGVVESVAFKYADRTYDKLQGIVSGRVAADVQSEFGWMASLFKRQVLGVGYARPNGVLSPTHEWSDVMRKNGLARSPSTSTGVAWHPRTSKYMQWKKKHFGHGRWFLNNNQVLPSTLGSGKNWVSYFGPIEVKLQRTTKGGGPSIGQVTSRSPYQAGQYTKFKSAEDSHIRSGIAHISVKALTHITPGMLPALASGNMGDYAPDGRKTGLLAKLPDAAAHRLGGRGVHYRHTIEPFLAFFLTRAVPNALFLRIERGLGATLSMQQRKN